MMRALRVRFGMRCMGATPEEDRACSPELCGGVVSFAGVHWGECPRTALRDPAFLAGLDVYNAGQAAPLAGWPTAWASYVSEVVSAITTAVADKQARKMEARRK